jgi:predicted nucleic acid-binding protein
MRGHPECKKPSDAVHLATALALSVDEMHTYDNSDLLKLDGKINCANGKPLKICRPSAPLPEPGLFSEIITEPKSKRRRSIEI